MLLAEHQRDADSPPGEEEQGQSRDNFSAMTPKGLSVAPRPENTAPLPYNAALGGGRPLRVASALCSREKGAGQSGRSRHKCTAALCPRPRGHFHQCHLGMDINRSMYFCSVLLCLILPPLPPPLPAVLLRRMESVGSAEPPTPLTPPSSSSRDERHGGDGARRG